MSDETHPYQWAVDGPPLGAWQSDLLELDGFANPMSRTWTTVFYNDRTGFRISFPHFFGDIEYESFLWAFHGQGQIKIYRFHEARDAKLVREGLESPDENFWEDLHLKLDWKLRERAAPKPCLREKTFGRFTQLDPSHLNFESSPGDKGETGFNFIMNDRKWAAALAIENWAQLMWVCEFDLHMEAYEKLKNIHASKGRHYHNAEHIGVCLGHLYDAKGLVQDWKSLALAFWFHDAIYKPFSSTNERDSADWAVEFLTGCGADEDLIDRVEALIMATVHGAEDLSGDLAFMVDIDLAILGAKPDIYDQYERNIRKEYRLVPGFIFKKKRKALLQSFLDQPRIYQTEHFHALWETQARENLGRAIRAL